ncbi:MAG: glycoside hydrolase family 88 protein [Ruminococcus sp.]|nr:glycoside hydrolase family 88 protein [Ruminococcus sp.]
MVDRYCRFHIGRWKSKTEWTEAVYKVCVKWSKKAPTVKITDNSRYVLLDMINGKYRSSSIQSWQTAAVVLGLLQKGDIENARKSAERYIDKSGQWKETPKTVDFGMLSYAILKTADNPENVKPAMDFTASLILNNIDEKGLIAYTNSKADPEKYVDTLGLVCPFLALYAKVYNKPEFEELAFKQLKFFHDNGLLVNTNLPNHAVNSNSNLPLGVYGWGRGVAWYTLGLIDTYYELENNEYKEKILKWINSASLEYVKYQRDDGGFGSSLQRQQTYDSSATAALAYFYIRCMDLFDESYYGTVVEKALEKLKKNTRITGKIDGCQGDTKGIGIFSQTYDIMPFAQGLALRTIELQRKINNNG